MVYVKAKQDIIEDWRFYPKDSVFLVDDTRAVALAGVVDIIDPIYAEVTADYVIFNGKAYLRGSVFECAQEDLATLTGVAMHFEEPAVQQGNLFIHTISATEDMDIVINNVPLNSFIILQITPNTKTITFPTDWQWVGGTIPTLSGNTDILTIFYDGAFKCISSALDVKIYTEPSG